MGNGGGFSPGAVIRSRARLWRVDDVQESVLTATAIDGEAIQRRASRGTLPLTIGTGTGRTS